MKNEFLKINKPCSEKWEQMIPNETGSFCDLCAKTVIDFTQLDQKGIAEKIKFSSNNMCARVTQTQLNTPFYELPISKQYNHLPYSKIAAGLMVATSLVTTQPVAAQNHVGNNQITQTAQFVEVGELLKQEKEGSDMQEIVSDNLIVFKGKIISEQSNTPINNATITWITLTKVIITYTASDGTFSVEIPEELLDNKNVVRVTYEEMKRSDKKDVVFGYETKDLVLSKQDIKEVVVIKARPEQIIMGDISYYSGDKNEPIVINNGVTVRYKDFVKARQGKKSSCSLENKESYYFESNVAVALYGKKAADGLYLFIDKKSVIK